MRILALVRATLRHVPVDLPFDAARIADLRRAYERAGLSEADLAADWVTQFRSWFHDAVQAGLPEPNAVVLATADPAGAPSARTVLLKGFDARGFVVYTNAQSRKGRDMTANPRAALVFPWHALERQVVVTGAVEQVPGDESDTYFRTRPRGSQLGAWASPQSDLVPSRAALEEAYAAVAARFADAREVPRPEHWGGWRVVPETVEFWQGRPNRLHDRLRYRRDAGDAWVVERLAP